MERLGENIISNNAPAFHTIFERFSATGGFGPGEKVCLIVEGGALRGVFSAGYAKAVAELLDPSAFVFAPAFLPT
ncbi:hypothetical protein [Shinella sp.]|uniref:hypothetical protein n=1 Tax=Shinella sp. TaxID=1870904 RepID=UPI0028B01D79|nr:hypothetical protein [Shinella sp.]